ncbi:hypothetical protein HAX54_008913 [Datura stramonium]|uniref:Ninja-family protein n=1 Tax=Datura stramonium TaxID=4076 RepID=A0ABS8WY16_DATST|nr:hypothetical protein [Datura stramonium]
MEVLNMHVHVRIDEKRKSRMEMENLSMETNRYSRDLLQRFMGGSSSSRKSGLEFVVAAKEEEEEEDEGEVELNLGLSLGGRFGVDKSSNNKLIRSSSVASCLPTVRDDDALAPPPVSYPTLVRTSSLPVETEEEWRKRKELQTLRRMEAKRRRSEKQRNLRGDKEGGGGIAVGSGELSPASIQSLQEGGSQDVGSSGSKMRDTGSRMSGGDMDSPSKKLEAAKSQAKETGANTLENMPCVFTKGDGPNGRRVDGILYRYGKGEEVRIMCVCHGSFHSPAEFVKHAGGADVAHPLKHIVINPNASPLL